MLFTPVLVLGMFLACVIAENRVAGVALGDWFRYGDFEAFLNTNDPSPSPQFTYPSSLKFLNEANETEWIVMSVENISYMHPFPYVAVFLSKTKHFRNGTDIIESGFVDIYAGLGNMTFQIISANLSVDDSVYAEIYSDHRIDKTVNRTYPSGVRETNHICTVRESNVTKFLNSESVNGTFNETQDYYWDKATGVLVEYSYYSSEEVGNWSSSWLMSYTLIESSTWVVPEYPTFLVVLAVSIAVTVSLPLHKRRHSWKIEGKP